MTITAPDHEREPNGEVVSRITVDTKSIIASVLGRKNGSLEAQGDDVRPDIPNTPAVEGGLTTKVDTLAMARKFIEEAKIATPNGYHNGSAPTEPLAPETKAEAEVVARPKAAAKAVETPEVLVSVAPKAPTKPNGHTYAPTRTVVVSNGSKPRPRPKQSNRPFVIESEVKQKSKKDKLVDVPEDDNVFLYLRDIGKHPLLTKEGEVALAQAIEAGNAARIELDAMKESGITDGGRRRELQRIVKMGGEANERFINSNLRLVVSIAKRYVNPKRHSLRLEDLVQEGNLGLMHAVEKFDWRKGFKFSTYATWWIRQSITRGIANTGRSIRLPVHASDLYKSAQRMRDELDEHARQLGNPPVTDEELAEALEVSVKQLREILDVGRKTLSLNDKLREDSDAERGDMVDDPESIAGYEKVENTVAAGEINKVLDRVLDEREKTIVILRQGLHGGEPRTLEEVGEVFNLTRERIRQIEARAMSKLRHPAAGDALRDLL